MKLSHQFTLNLNSTVTPADAGASGTYKIGPTGQVFTLPTDADVIVARDLTLTSGVAKVYEPDTNTYDGEGSPPADADGVTVGLSNLYMVYVQNTHATLNMTFVSANFADTDEAELSATLSPGGALVLGPFATAVGIGATTTFTMKGLTGATTCRIIVWGS